MCMIAFRPIDPLKGKQGGANIPNDVIDLAMNRHPDGFGVAWREFGADGVPTLKVERFGPKSRKQFRKAVKRVDRSGVEYVAHFRFGTHGPSDLAHAHPFEYMDPQEGRTFIFHNGVIDIQTLKSESDTEVFVRDVLATLPSRWWTSPAMRFLVNQSTGWSKIVVMTARETVSLREDEGTWDGGIWYSSSHKSAWSSGYTSKWAGYATGKVRTPSADDEAYWDANGYEFLPNVGWVKRVEGSSAATSAGTFAAAGLLGTGTTPPEGGCANPALLPVGNEADLTDAEYNAVQKAYGHTDGRVPLVPQRDVDARFQFRSAGHNLTAIKFIDREQDGDHLDAVVCDECYTTGDVYVVDGQVHIDMAHKGMDREEDEEDDTVLVEAVVRNRLRVLAN